MKKIIFLSTITCLITTSCSKELLRKHRAEYKVNGIKVLCDENTTGASYDNGNTSRLVVDCVASDATGHNLIFTLDLDKVNQTVAVDSAEAGFTYFQNNSAYQYHTISGEWKITSHIGGDNNDKHTEGIFTITLVSNYLPLDTVYITDGSFYVNKY